MKKAAKAYDAGSIRQLKGLEAVRERVGMYLGDPTSGDALHHCVGEVVDNAIDEHVGGHGDKIIVRLLKHDAVEIVDYGRGIPVGTHADTGLSALEMVMCSLHSGGKFDHDSYEKAAGLHGVGVSAVNAVSEHMTVVVRRDGAVWEQKYARGIPQGPVQKIAALKKGEPTGTTVTWRRDEQIFSGVLTYDRRKVAARLQELAFLNPGLTIELEDERGKSWGVTFHYEGGIKDYVEEATKKGGITPVLFFTNMGTVEVAMRWTTSGEEVIRCYANNTYNSDGGTHLTGFKNGLTRLISGYAKEHDMLKGVGEEGVTGADIREGLVAVISLKIRDTSFSSQTKDKLVTAGARTLVEDLFADQISDWFAANPGVAKKITERAVIAAKAREAARKARDAVRKTELFDQLSLPGKLADCQSRDPRECELVICEGDSAGGSAKGGRDRRIQAVLPLRGKILNTERADAETISENKELGTIIGALGCGLEHNATFDARKLRYHKIVLMTDADVDGAHIRTLLLTFFYRCMPQLLWDGYVYVAQPPLYGVQLRNRSSKHYFTTAEEFRAWLDTLPESVRGGAMVTRYKGLGEMSAEELWVTTMNPETRQLKQVTISDARLADRAFDLLMGSDVERRRDWIETHFDTTLELDL